MKRFFVMGKHIMLASVLFAGLALTSCDKDDEPEAPSTSQGSGDKNQNGDTTGGDTTGGDTTGGDTTGGDTTGGDTTGGDTTGGDTTGGDTTGGDTTGGDTTGGDTTGGDTTGGDTTGGDTTGGDTTGGDTTGGDTTGGDTTGGDTTGGDTTGGASSDGGDTTGGDSSDSGSTDSGSTDSGSTDAGSVILFEASDGEMQPHGEWSGVGSDGKFVGLNKFKAVPTATLQANAGKYIVLKFFKTASAAATVFDQLGGNCNFYTNATDVYGSAISGESVGLTKGKVEGDNIYFYVKVDDLLAKLETLPDALGSGVANWWNNGEGSGCQSITIENAAPVAK